MPSKPKSPKQPQVSAHPVPKVPVSLSTYLSAKLKPGQSAPVFDSATYLPAMLQVVDRLLLNKLVPFAKVRSNRFNSESPPLLKYVDDVVQAGGADQKYVDQAKQVLPYFSSLNKVGSFGAWVAATLRMTATYTEPLHTWLPQWDIETAEGVLTLCKNYITNEAKILAAEERRKQVQARLKEMQGLLKDPPNPQHAPFMGPLGSRVVVHCYLSRIQYLQDYNAHLLEFTCKDGRRMGYFYSGSAQVNDFPFEIPGTLVGSVRQHRVSTQYGNSTDMNRISFTPDDPSTKWPSV